MKEEYGVKRFQTPILGAPFEVWQAGSVAKDIFIDLLETPVVLDGYVEKEVVEGKTCIKAKAVFFDDDFSDNDINMMDDVIRKYGQMTARQLVDLTHQEGSLWQITAERNRLLEALAKKELNNSD